MPEWKIDGSNGHETRSVQVVAHTAVEAIHIVLQARGHGFRVTGVREIDATPIGGNG